MHRQHEMKSTRTDNMQDELLHILKEVGAIYTDDHFVYTSGKHGSVYVNKDALYPHTKYSSRIGQMFAEKYKNADIDVVAAPALGGIVLSQWTAYFLSQMTGKDVLGVYTEKTLDKNQVFTRGYDKLVTGKRVLVIEDLANTGGSVKKVVDSVREVGGEVAAVCVMVNRNPEGVTTETMGAPFDSLAVFKAEAWDQKDCSLCKQGVPVNTKVGHGAKYVAEQQK